jgi:hypothetical protein
LDDNFAIVLLLLLLLLLASSLGLASPRLVSSLLWLALFSLGQSWARQVVALQKPRRSPTMPRQVSTQLFQRAAWWSWLSETFGSGLCTPDVWPPDLQDCTAKSNKTLADARIGAIGQLPWLWPVWQELILSNFLLHM